MNITRKTRTVSGRFRAGSSGLALASLLLMSSTLFSGCTSTTSTKAETKIESYSFWPQFPSDPRMQFLVSFRYSSDIEEPMSRLEELLYGKEATTLPIVKPYGVQMWEGKVYVCDIKNPGVVVLDLENRQTRVMSTTGLGGMQQPTDIAITPDGMKYVADSVRGVVFVFDADERHVQSFGHQGFRPVGIAAFEDRLYVSDFATNRIIILDRGDGRVLGEIGEPGGEDGQFVRPLGVAVDAEGNIYVTDVIRCRLQKFNPEGELLFATGQINDTAGSFVRPKHLAVDETGTVFVVDAAFNNVQLFNDEGSVMMYFGNVGPFPGSMDLPAGICISVNQSDLKYFEQYIHPAFKAERLVLVTNQFGVDKIAVYAMGELAEGYTADDTVSAVNKAETEPVSHDAPGVIPFENINAESEDEPSEDPEDGQSPDDTGEPEASGAS